jgi:hypothetical protein
MHDKHSLPPLTMVNGYFCIEGKKNEVIVLKDTFFLKEIAI